MENTTPDSLEEAIQQWRVRLAQSPALKKENVKELEAHLRDSMARLQSKGLSGEESFLIASRRLGEGERLEREFGKVNASELWLSRVWWMLVGVQVWGFVVTFSNNFVQYGVLAAVYNFGQSYGFDLEAAALVASLIASVGAYLGLSWLFWRLTTRKADAIMRSATRFGVRSRYLPVCLCATVLWAAAYLLSMPMQIAAFKTVPLIHMYQRFTNLALLRQVTFWLQPLVLMTVTFLLALRKSRPVRN
jgi:hypothetical protein